MHVVLIMSTNYEELKIKITISFATQIMKLMKLGVTAIHLNQKRKYAFNSVHTVNITNSS